MSLAELFDEPQHARGPDAQRCSASEHPVEWAELSVGWSQVLQAARTIQQRHVSDSGDHVLVQCADAAREAAVSELRWCWARAVNKYIEGVSADV
ncbi:Uncharacterised protein [Mycobacteroides abscessus subsp. abscessus]|nr:hypothetical protein [Mycobacteroides abscessus subsp. abscessus]MBN7329837.1 hypothetical protein [Mycobacteroides abscessus subsp. abscessus]SID95376.1 Uncharacterised protein [Mycobacteroides abscessus subsp. abscessus]SIF36552.1 Uncharacterised protein [Mycobacteroides abscessus subsp. abscessus]SIF71333.1 Uncharacterised protein [Mycobacteroides abscessus subsp. abscessus]